jgi:hypothetical protein
MKASMATLLSLILVCGLIYGMYLAFKTLSYVFFYESMVQQTVKEMVKPEYLK